MAHEFEQICGSCGKQITLVEADAYSGICNNCFDKSQLHINGVE